MIAVVVALIALGAVAVIVVALREPPPPQHRLDSDLTRGRWDRRRTDRWT